MSTTRSLVKISNLDASKGYAFITCENQRTAQRILQLKQHVIQDRVVEVTEALGRQGLAAEEAAARGPRRLFIGGLSHRSTRGSFRLARRPSGVLLNVWRSFKRLRDF